MRADLLKKFNTSYERVVECEDFFDRFYFRFMASSDDIFAKFQNTDMQTQKDVMRMSLIYVVNFFVNHQAGERMEEMAFSHSKEQMDIHPRYYQLWLDAIVETVKEFDDESDEATELAWRVVLAPGIEYMKFYYDKASSLATTE